jgi:nucleoid-associated protein YejK
MRESMSEEELRTLDSFTKSVTVPSTKTSKSKKNKQEMSLSELRDENPKLAQEFINFCRENAVEYKEGIPIDPKVLKEFKKTLGAA